MKDVKTEENDIFIFGMKNLLVEKNLEKLELEGIDLGHHETVSKSSNVDLELFELDILKKAKKMANFYILYFSLENSIRKLIRDVLFEEHGEYWWDEKVPEGVKDTVKVNKQKEMRTAMTLRSHELEYTNFGELIDIILANWKDFSGILRSRSSVKETLAPLNKIRSVIAHSNELSNDEISRFELLIKDWLRIQN